MVLLRQAGKAAVTAPKSTLIIDDLVLRAEVSRQLDVSEHTLRNWELGGEGPPTIRIGRRVYYRAESLRRWLLDQEEKTPST